MSIIMLPVIFLHELSHFLVARQMGVDANIVLLDRKNGDYLSIGEVTNFQRLAIGLAPLLLLPLSTLTIILVAQLEGTGPINLILILYSLAFVFQSFPSRGDIGHLPRSNVIHWIIFITSIIYIVYLASRLN